MTKCEERVDEHRVMVVMPEAMFGQVKARAAGNGRCVGREVAKMVEGVLVREAKRVAKHGRGEVCHG